MQAGWAPGAGHAEWNDNTKQLSLHDFGKFPSQIAGGSNFLPARERHCEIQVS